MSSQIDKSIYVKFWDQLNPSKDQCIRTTKVIEWTKKLLSFQKQQSLKKTSPSKQNKEKKSKQLEKQDKKKKQAVKGKKPQEKAQFNKEVDQNHQTKPQTIEFKQKLIDQDVITQDVILSYINKYLLTDQYKTLSTVPNPTDFQPAPQQQKEKKTVSKSLSKKQTKKARSLNKVLEVKYDDSLISLTFEEAIFFYFWFKKLFEKDQKEQFIKKIRAEEDQITESKENEMPEEIKLEEPQGSQPKYFMQLSERQMGYLNEQSFISLKQHEPKLQILFKHYSRLSHMLTKQIFTFEERNILDQMMTLHQWMVFCKDWNILNAKSINEGWEKGKVTREFLMEVYYRHSFFRKEMSFEMFERALISIAARMFQDCDVYKFKPVDLMLSFLSIKDQIRFLGNLQERGIAYRQGQILNCFKEKNRDAYAKMNIIKVMGSQTLNRKSTFAASFKSTKLGGQNISGNERYIQRQDLKPLQNNDYRFPKTGSVGNLKMTTQDSDFMSSKLIRSNSTVGQGRGLVRNGKSAPQINLKLPTIENNRFFNHIPQNNHMNKFRQYIKNELPESSSVYRNKITGYHKIHELQSQEEVNKLSLKNKVDHQRITRLIGGKLQTLFDSNAHLEKPFAFISPREKPSGLLQQGSKISSVHVLNPQSNASIGAHKIVNQKNT